MVDISNMTLREKICQTIIITEPKKTFEEYGGCGAFLQRYPVGGIYLGGSIVGGKMAGVEEVFEARKEWADFLKVPPLYCADFEMGTFGIHQMALGAADDDDLVYRVWKESAANFAKSGRNWAFAPVADLAMTPFAPINIRSLGSDPEKVSELLCKTIEGMASEKVIACAKHFPGMGRESMDTHLTKVEVGLTREEWDNTYRKIYKKMIDDGLLSVMSAHMSLPCLQSERDEYGSAPIATVSKELITDLLKNDLGFEGIVVTDALSMGGAGSAGVQFAIDAFLAGHDMLLWPDIRYADVLEEKILCGEIPMARLDDAVERILRVKKIMNVGDDIIPQARETYAVPSEIAEKAVTLLNNRKNLIPLDADKIKKVFLVCVAKDKSSYEKLTYLKKVFENRGIEVKMTGDIWLKELAEGEKETDLTVFACFEGPNAVPGPITLNGENGASVWASQKANPERTIVASFGSPYLYNQYYRHYSTYMNLYSPGEAMCEAFVKAIFGEIECCGKSPV